MVTMTRSTLLAMVPLLLLAGCGNAAPPKDLGCLDDLGNAESSMQTLAGIGTTSTVSDAAAALGTIRSKLGDLAVVNADATVKARATDGATRAGKVRVALVDGGGTPVSDTTALRLDINALDARCTALGK